MSTVLETKLTPEEYLAQEVASELRHEYRQGDLIPMAGGTTTHNELIRSLTVILSLALKGQPFQVFITDQRLWIPQTQSFYYPDVMITPKPVPLLEGRRDTVMEPLLIAEVLSESTEERDRGAKFLDYRQIPTLQEYLLIDQNKPYVEQYTKKAEHQWLLTIYTDLAQAIPLDSVNILLNLSELYENVVFGGL